MKSLARWLAAWACFAMLIGPTTQMRAAEPPGGAPAAAAPKEARESERLDLSYVPADAVAAIVVRPQAVLTSADAELLPVEVITALGQKQFGFDPVKIRKAILFIRPPADPRDPAAAVILQFSEPYSQAAVIEKSRGKEVEIDGKKFIEPAMFNPALIYFPDDKTLIFATPQLMKQMLTGKEADTPLVGLLRKTNLSSDLTAVVSVDMVRPQLKQLVGQAPPLPPPLQGFLKAPDLLSAVMLRADVGDKFKASLALRARDEASSAEVEQLINQALEMGKQMVLAQVTPRPRPAPDPVEAASLKYTQRLLDKFLGAVKPVRNGQNVTISFETGSSVATIGVLVALLLPAINAAREAANRNTNFNKLRQIAIAMHNYEAGHRRYPARAVFDKDGKPLLSWRVMLLPMLEENDLYKQFHLDEPWDSEHNKPLIARMPSAFAKAGRDPNDGKTVFQVPVGKGLAFDGTHGLTEADFADGSSKTLLALEVNDDRAVPWTKPDDLEVDMEKPLAGLGHAEAGGITCAVFVDGHAFGFTSQIDIPTLKALFTRNGNEPIDDELIR